jgi:hypothetical protein
MYFPYSTMLIFTEFGKDLLNRRNTLDTRTRTEISQYDSNLRYNQRYKASFN